MKVAFSWQIFKKILKCNISRRSVQWELSRLMWTDRQTDRQRQTDTHRQTETDRHTQTDRQRHRQTWWSFLTVPFRHAANAASKHGFVYSSTFKIVMKVAFFWQIFKKILKCNISRRSVQWELSRLMWTDRQTETDRYTHTHRQTHTDTETQTDMMKLLNSPFPPCCERS